MMNLKSFPSISIILTILFTIFPENAYSITGMVKVAENVCFDAASYSTGDEFSPPYTGVISGIKLVHNDTNGFDGVTCTSGVDKTNWGCRTELLMVHLINEVTQITVYPTSGTTGNWEVTEWENDCICDAHYYKIDGIGSDSDEYSMMDTDNQVIVSTSDKFSLQYSEGCGSNDCAGTAGDNSGTSCADVYFNYIDQCSVYCAGEEVGSLTCDIESTLPFTGFEFPMNNANYLLMGVLFTNFVIILFFIGACFRYNTSRKNTYSKVKHYEQVINYIKSIFACYIQYYFRKAPQSV